MNLKKLICWVIEHDAISVLAEEPEPTSLIPSGEKWAREGPGWAYVVQCSRCHERLDYVRLEP